MDISVYEAGDTGPSGHGQVFRGHLKTLLQEYEEVSVTARTHQWGWNRTGMPITSNRGFTDSRFQYWLMGDDRFNEEYLVRDQAEIEARPDDLVDNLGTPETARPYDCLVREVESDEEMDVWHTVGGMSFCQQAPTEDAYTIVETDYNLDMVPPHWPGGAEMVDEVWVPNEWNKKAWEARNANIDNIRVMPYGVDFSYKPTDYDCELCPANHHTQPVGEGHCLGDDTFTFLSVARWYHIKGVDRLIEAYLQEFTGDEDVRLFLKTTMNKHRQFQASEPAQVIQQAVSAMGIDDPPEIGVRVEAVDDQHFMDLMGVADAFALPSRAECVGISWVQAMHAGTPVVTTNWSAMDEYLEDDHAILVDEYQLERPKQHQPGITFGAGANYPPDANWADPDVDALRAALRRAYEMDSEEREEMTTKARQHVHEVFDWERCMEQRVERFREVA